LILNTLCQVRALYAQAGDFDAAMKMSSFPGATAAEVSKAEAEVVSCFEAQRVAAIKELVLKGNFREAKR